MNSVRSSALSSKNLLNLSIFEQPNLRNLVRPLDKPSGCLFPRFDVRGINTFYRMRPDGDSTVSHKLFVLQCQLNFWRP